ncbi:ARM repeat superfamily protein isoform X2 [Tasmannia lanceolata]|uniref:ARM repeat superfamily protein isoform X2 n=1 Tax=Tasmannia lanceolata TaxID=3420 RepID=UPI0040641E3E
MANPSSWIPHVESFVDSSRPSNQQDASLDAVAALLKNDLLTIETLVTAHYVLSCVLLLAEVLKRIISKPLDSATIHSLMGFFTSRLADWQALRGALLGCLALLTRKTNVGRVLDSDSTILANSFLQTLQVQSLAFHDRKLCFEVLACLLDHYPDAFVALGDHLVYGICESIDEEKDPRCLMITFHIVESLVKVFPDPFGPVASFAGDLFEILGRYFPIYFTHPNKDDFDVTRDDLSRALMYAFSSTPFFEPFAIPLLLDKLSSSLPQAKLDSLKYLSNCTLHYGMERIGKHAKSIWSSLKDSICSFDPKQPLFSLNSNLPEDTASKENEITKEALKCLQSVMCQLDRSNDVSFVSLIVEDEELEMIFKSTTRDRSYKDIPIESKTKLHALGSILSVSAKVSNTCCNRVFQSFFPRLMDILGISLGSPSLDCNSNDNYGFIEKLKFGALYVCVELLDACRDLAVGTEESLFQSIIVQDSWFSFLQNFSGPLARAFVSTLITTGNLESGEADIYCGVKGLQILATFPGLLMPTSNTSYESILKILVSVITTCCDKRFLWKLALKALVEIGTFIEKFHESGKRISYINIVVEEILMLLSFDNYDMPLPLRMEAISSIGAAGPSFMLRVVQGLEEAISANFLEATVKGNLKSVEILICLQECYSSHVLPWFHKTGGAEEVALRFAVNIWDQMEKNLTFNIGIQGQVLLDSTMTAMRLAVGGCMQENQCLIVQKAFDLLISTTSFPLKESDPFSMSTKLEGLKFYQDLSSLSCRDEWLILLFASVLIALRPQTPLPEVRVILKFFMVLILLKGHIPVAQAVGSMINKWPVKINTMEVSSSCTLEEALEIIFEMGLHSVLDNGPLRKSNYMDLSRESVSNLCLIVGSSRLVQIHAIVGLAWIGKGLLMRGHDKVKEISLLLLKCLLLNGDMEMVTSMVDTVGNGKGQDTQPLLARSAADAFHVLLSDSKECLNKKFHATIRLLYKQHFFSTMMPIFLSSIKESDSSTTRAMLYRAFGHVICSAPLVAVVSEAKKLIPSLLDGLSMLSPDILNKDLTYSLLLVLSGIIMDENGKEAILEYAHGIIIHLIRLLSYPHMMLVRETAIQCLGAMSGLPYVRIYPMRAQVLKSVSKILDDKKRNVRLEASRCRQAWASLTS